MWLKNIGHETWFFYYVAGAALVSLLVYVFMGESSRHSQLECEAAELACGQTQLPDVAQLSGGGS